MSSIAKTGLLLAAMTALFGIIGLLLGGKVGMLLALGFGAVMNFFSYWKADKIVLKMYKAQPIDPATATAKEKHFYDLTMGLVHRAQMPEPKICIINNPQPNAFATGRNPENAAVCATTGLLEILTDEEVAGVMAHELAHVKNRDTLTMTVTATIAGAITTLANFAMFFRGGNNRGGLIGSLAVMFLAPMAAGIVQMAISRTREYEADKIGAEICGQPLWLASALAKISQGAAKIPNQTAEMHPETGQLMIINPLSGKGRDNLFSTHPATQNRIDALIKLAEQNGQSDDKPQNTEPNAGPWG